jgi:hypothetical protein
VAHEVQPRFLAQLLAKQAGFRIGRRDMRVIAARLAAKVPLAVATRAGRLTRAVLRTKAREAGPGYSLSNSPDNDLSAALAIARISRSR